MTRITTSQALAPSSGSALDIALPGTGGALIGLFIGAGGGGDTPLFGIVSAVGLAAFVALYLIRSSRRAR